MSCIATETVKVAALSFVIVQEDLKPILLRRMKEDVENLPEKEEVVVWVQLTHQQRTYYKALYSNQVSAALNYSAVPFNSAARTRKSVQNHSGGTA